MSDHSCVTSSAMFLDDLNQRMSCMYFSVQLFDLLICDPARLKLRCTDHAPFSAPRLLLQLLSFLLHCSGSFSSFSGTGHGIGKVLAQSLASGSHCMLRQSYVGELLRCCCLVKLLWSKFLDRWGRSSFICRATAPLLSTHAWHHCCSSGMTPQCTTPQWLLLVPSEGDAARDHSQSHCI